MATFTKRVNTGNDDGYKSSGTWRPSLSFISTGNGITTAVRFTNITIPAGATISNATIQFYFSGGFANSQNLKVYGIDEDNTATLSSDPTGRTKTTAAVDWDFSAASIGQTRTTSNLSSIVQEIINRGGWSSGNAIGFLIENDGSSFGHDFDSYEGDSTKAAYLSITYTTPTTSTSSTTTTSTSTTTTQSSTTSTSSTTTSTTTTSTSTTTTSTSTTTIPPVYTEERIGIKVSKPDKDASSSNPNNFLLHSQYPQLIVHQEGQFSHNFVDNDPFEISHGLNYRPFALGFLQFYNGLTDTVETEFRLLDWSIEGATYQHYSRMEIGKNTLKFVVTDTNLSGFVNLKGFYIVFTLPIEELFR